MVARVVTGQFLVKIITLTKVFLDTDERSLII